MGIKSYLCLITIFFFLIQPTCKASEDNCSLGFFGSCFVNKQSQNLKSTKWRYETFAGYKSKMSYYETEQENCTGDCKMDVSGGVIGFDVYKNVSGHTRSAEFVDMGLSYMKIPIASWESEAGFAGTKDSFIPQGSGSLSYHFVRFNVKRGSFLYLIKSRYLISSFGAGVAIPDTSGEGDFFVGGRGVLPTIGGKLGAQFSVNESVDIGVASGWSVLWYGRSMWESAFVSSFGIHLSIRV